MASRRFLSQAALQALVRYGPELSGLKELQRQAESNLALAVRQAQGTAAGTQAAVSAARAPLAAVYDKAGLDQSRTASLLGADVSALGPVANSIKAGSALEAANMADQLSTARTAALTDLTSRGVRAKEGETFAVNQARQQFVNDLTKILGRKQDLRREKGAFTAATVDTLAQKAADRALKRSLGSASNATRLAVAGVDAQGNPLPGRHPDGRGRSGSSATKLPGGAKELPLSSHNTLKTEISAANDQAQAFIQGAIKQGKGRGFVNAALRDGIPGYVVHDPSTGRVKIDPNTGAPVTAPGLKGVGEIERNVILDLAFYKGVSPATARKLHGMGYSVKRLGLPVVNPRQLQSQRQAAGTATGAGQIAGLLAHVLGLQG